MKNSASKLTLFVSAFALCGLFATPIVRAADENSDAKAGKRAERKAKQEAQMLRKYDANGNGVLDPDEQAAMKADQDKAKAQRAAQRKAKATEKAKLVEPAQPAWPMEAK